MKSLTYIFQSQKITGNQLEYIIEINKQKYVSNDYDQL